MLEISVVLGGDDLASRHRSESGRIAVGGIDLSTGQRIANRVFTGFDFSGTSFSNLWIESCRFLDCTFVKCNLSGVREHGNSFERCVLEKVSFRGAGLGYKGSSYIGCDFRDCIFTKAVFCRPEISSCVISGKVVGVDFNAASFQDSKFVGYFEDLWFRGGFPHPTMEKQFGVPHRNIMRNVDFSRADISWLNFSDNVPLDSVILPMDENVVRFNHWGEVLRAATRSIDAYFPSGSRDRQDAEIYVRSHEAHAVNQSWFIENFRVWTESNRATPAYGGKLKAWLQDARKSLGTIS